MDQAVSESIVIVEPSSGWRSLGLASLWEYHELLYFLLWRDVKGRYRQMAFGPLWIVAQPLVNMLTFSLVFGRLAGLPSDGVPYPVFTLVALLPWQFFANATRNAANSLLNEQHVISKVYYPRLLIPISTVLSALVDFMVSFILIVIMLVFYRVVPPVTIVVLPLYLLLAAAAALGVGLLLASLAVKFRDVPLGLNLALTVWQYVTPVAYSATLVPEQWRTIYRLNPMAVVVEGFRSALLRRQFGPVDSITLASVAIVVVILVAGAYYFRATERTIVDVL